MAKDNVVVALTPDDLPYVAISHLNLQPAFPPSGSELWPFYANANRRQMLLWVSWNVSDYCQRPDERHAVDVLAEDARDEVGRGLTRNEYKLLAECVRDHFVVTYAMEEDASERARKQAALEDTQRRLHDPLFGYRR